MNQSDATAAFAALGQGHRLTIFRLLMDTEPDGLTAGTIAERLGLKASSLSTHLAVLERASLLRSRRVHRHIYYAIDIAGTRALLGFLTHDCCRGHPEICGFPADACDNPNLSGPTSSVDCPKEGVHREE